MLYTFENSLGIKMREWGETCASSQRHILVTDVFGPNYVVTFYDPNQKTVALAHLDTAVQFKSLDKIFEIFQNMANLQAHIMGGWKNHHESKPWGEKLIKILQSKGIININTEYMFKKDTKRLYHGGYQVEGDLTKLCFKHASIDSKTGKVVCSDRIIPQKLFGGPFTVLERNIRVDRLPEYGKYPVEKYPKIKTV